MVKEKKMRMEEEMAMGNESSTMLSTEAVNPARINEDYCLELSGVGERPGSWSSGCPEEGGPRCFVSL